MSRKLLRYQLNPTLNPKQPQQQQPQRSNDGNTIGKTEHRLIVALVVSLLFNAQSLYNSYRGGTLEPPADRLENSLKDWRVLGSQTLQNVSNNINITKVGEKHEGDDYEARFRRVDAIYRQFYRNHYVRPNRGKCFNPTVEKRKNLSSSIEFIGCCGLGHRLARMAASAHIAADFECPLFGFWGCCEGKVSVFHHLFGDEPLIVGPLFERIYASQTNHHHLMFISETPGFRIINGKKLQNLCPLREEKVVSDYRFYKQLRDHYHNKKAIDAFVRDHFHGRLVFGLHVRAGNGEGGDFARKGRGVGDSSEFVKMLSKKIRELVQIRLKDNHNKPPILFVATDTPSVVTLIQSQLNDTIPVLDMPQVRLPEGQGVFFGEKGDVVKRGSSCLDGWDGAVGDMILLSHVDILLVPNPSSFTQTMPASLIMGKPNRLKNAFCELQRTEGRKQLSQPRWKCFDTVKQWSCGTVANKPTLFDANLDHRRIL